MPGTGTLGRAVKRIAAGLALLGFLLAPARAGECLSPSALTNPARTLQVVLDNNYPPYVFTDEQGRLQGILVDQWRLWERRTGVGAELHGMDWGDALRRMEAGEFDVIDTVFFNERRAKIFDFTRPYARLEVPIFFRSDIRGIAGPDSLKGFVVAAKKGDAAVDFLQAHGVRRIELFNSYEEIIQAARDQRVVVFVIDQPPALHYIYKYGLQGKIRATDPLYAGEFHRAVRKGNSTTLTLIENGFHEIGPDALQKIDQKWQGHRLDALPYLRWLGGGAGAVAAGILLLLAWNRALQRTVHTKTRELRESERNYRELFNTSHEAILLHDPATGRVLDANRTALEMFGCTAAEIRELPVQTFSEGSPAYGPEQAVEYITRAAAGGRELFEWRSRRRDGQLFWSEVALKRISVGGKDQILAAVRDITERKTLEERLRQSEKMESIGLLAGGIAHDFNNQLGGIMGCAELLCQQSLNHASREHVDGILSSCRHAAQLTRQLLAFARKGKYQMEPVDIHPLIAETANLLRRSLDPRVVIHPDLAAGRTVVNGDATQIQNALLNLALNARDAMPDGGDLRIFTENRRLDAAAAAGLGLTADTYLHLTVADTGAGMDDATLKRIFEPFFTTKENQRGTGLGLAVVYGTIRSHKGAIRATSHPGRGTCFDLYLPVLTPGQAAGLAPNPPAPAAATPAPEARKQLLVVDDEPGIVRVVSRMLQDQGFEVAAFTDSRQALEYFREKGREIDLVLLDMMMPDLGGDEFFARIRAIHPAIRVLVMSGYSHEEVAQQVLAKGALGFIEKPFKREELLARIAAALAKPINPAASGPGSVT